jgi:DNA primase
VDLALARGMNVKILTIDEPEVKDAADFVKKHGETWVAYTEKAQPFMEYFYGHFRKSVDLASATGKKLFSQKFFPFVAAISNTIEQRHWIQEAAVALKVNEEIVAREIASIKPRVPSETPDSPVANIQSPAAEELHLYEESLLGLLLKKPALVSQLTAEYLEFVSPAFKDILPKVKNFKAKAQAASADPSEVRPMLLDIAYLKSQEFWKDFDDEAIDGEFTKLLNHLKRRTIVARLESLEYDIKQAERDGDASRLATLVGQFTQLSSQL